MCTSRRLCRWLLAGMLVAGLLVADLPAFEFDDRAGFALENGDTNGDLERDMSDAIYLLNHLFLGGPAAVPLASCGASAAALRNGDSNGDASVDLSDGVYLLGWLYGAGPPPAVACTGGRGAAGNPNPRVVPPNASPFGISLGDWGAEWWQWALEIGPETNPIADETGEFCGVGQTRKVWFLAGTFGGFFERTCTVPAGKAILLPLLNVVSAPGFCETPEGEPCETEDEVRADANAAIEAVSGLELEVDGVVLTELQSYRAESVAFTLDLPEGNLLGPDSMVLEPSVSDGFWIMLAPLTPGDHTIHARGEFGGGFPDGFETEVLYHVHVTE